MGRKRVRTDTDFQIKKKNCAERSCVVNDDDRISQLSDDILVDILSLLSLKEAGRTSVLSSRWINLWKNIPSLNFDGRIAIPKDSLRRGKSKSLEKVEKQYKLIKSERPKYLKWVNSVIQSHKSPTLKQFRIRYTLDTSDTSDMHSITRWLQFASSKQVQSLELDFHTYKSCDYYRFPQELFTQCSPIFEFKSLKSLFLKKINVSGGAIELFLRNCPLLEKLIVHDPAITSTLEVCGSSLVLKHLEILNCKVLIKISAPTLTSLSVTSLKGVFLENIPMLVTLSVTSKFYDCHCLKDLISEMSCCVSRLESLSFSLGTCYVRQEMDEICNFPEMPKLKKLVIDHGGIAYDFCLVRTTSLTRASPYLEEFVFTNKWFGASSVESRRVDDDNDDDAIIRFRHEHLKVFKFCGYRGRPYDIALVRYIMKNCVALEKIIIDPSSGYFYNRSSRSDVDEAVREKAKQHLQPQLPHHVELLVL